MRAKVGGGGQADVYISESSTGNIFRSQNKLGARHARQTETRDSRAAWAVAVQADVGEPAAGLGLWGVRRGISLVRVSRGVLRISQMD